MNRLLPTADSRLPRRRHSRSTRRRGFTLIEAVADDGDHRSRACMAILVGSAGIPPEEQRGPRMTSTAMLLGQRDCASCTAQPAACTIPITGDTNYGPELRRERVDAGGLRRPGRLRRGRSTGPGGRGLDLRRPPIGTGPINWIAARAISNMDRWAQIDHGSRTWTAGLHPLRRRITSIPLGTTDVVRVTWLRCSYTVTFEDEQ